jgi:hypothetical protein
VRVPFTDAQLCDLDVPFDTSKVTITLAESGRFSPDDLQDAADVVLDDFSDCTPCTLLSLGYEEGFSRSHEWLTTDLLPNPDAEWVVLSGSFAVDWRGAEFGLNANSTYENMTWAVARTDADAPWVVINKGIA